MTLRIHGFTPVLLLGAIGVGAMGAQPAQAQQWRVCRQISDEFREVYAFETESFYINICQQGDRYTLINQPKASPTDAFLLPAQQVESNAFVAVSGSTRYRVNPVTLADRSGPNYELIIEENGRRIAQENSGGYAVVSSPDYQPDATLLTFQTASSAVRIYTRAGRMLMNIYDRQADTTWLKDAPVIMQSNQQGINYIYLGRQRVKVFQSRFDNTRTLQIDNNPVEPAI